MGNVAAIVQALQQRSGSRIYGTSLELPEDNGDNTETTFAEDTIGSFLEEQ